MVRPTPQPPQPGQPAPDFKLADLNGQIHRLSDLRGKIVLVAFWSATCPHVSRMDTALLGLLDKWGGEVVYLPVACNANESPAQMRQTAAEYRLNTVLWDKDSAIANMYGAEITPEFFILDRDGVIAYHGAFDDASFRQRQPTRCHVQEVVDALLAGAAPETDFVPAYGCAIVRFSNLIA